MLRGFLPTDREGSADKWGRLVRQMGKVGATNREEKGGVVRQLGKFLGDRWGGFVVSATDRERSDDSWGSCLGGVKRCFCGGRTGGVGERGDFRVLANC